MFGTTGSLVCLVPPAVVVSVSSSSTMRLAPKSASLSCPSDVTHRVAGQCRAKASFSPKTIRPQSPSAMAQSTRHTATKTTGVFRQSNAAPKPSEGEGAQRRLCPFGWILAPTPQHPTPDIHIIMIIAYNRYFMDNCVLTAEILGFGPATTSPVACRRAITI